MNILWRDYEPFGAFLWIETEYGMEYLNYLNKQVRKFLEDDLVFIENNILKPTDKKESFDRWNYKWFVYPRLVWDLTFDRLCGRNMHLWNDRDGLDMVDVGTSAERHEHLILWRVWSLSDAFLKEKKLLKISIKTKRR
jgi:hypothetical protein